MRGCAHTCVSRAGASESGPGVISDSTTLSKPLTSHRETGLKDSIPSRAGVMTK